MGYLVSGRPTTRVHGDFGRWFSGLDLDGTWVTSSPHVLARIQLSGQTGKRWPSHMPRRKMK